MISEPKCKVISPKQPYFVMAASQYYKAVVMNYGISHFYCFEKDNTIKNSIIAVPDGCIDILFCCDDKEPSAFICGTVLQPKLVHNENKYFFGVRFMPGSFLKFKDISMSDYVEKEISFMDIIKDKEWFDEITSSRDFSVQTQLFMNKYLKLYEKFEQGNKHKALKQFLVKSIMETAGQVRINELAEKTGYSVRYINKMFSEEFGLSPKLFSKLMRFQHLLSNLNGLKEEIFHINLTQLATELGYYDQSHMIKEFHEFADKTPGNYIHDLEETDYKKRLVIL